VLKEFCVSYWTAVRCEAFCVPYFGKAGDDLLRADSEVFAQILWAGKIGRDVRSREKSIGRAGQAQADERHTRRMT
jgi:hypothetical protein